MASRTLSPLHIATVSYDYDREHFTDMLATLSEVADGKLTFSMGCDFHVSPQNVEDAMADPRRFAIGDTQYLLIEFDHYGIPPMRVSN